MDTQKEKIRLASMIIALVTARIQSLQEKKSNLNLTFRLKCDVLQDEIFDVLVLRADWEKERSQNKNIYICLIPKIGLQFKDHSTGTDSDITSVLQKSFSLYKKFKELLETKTDENFNQMLNGVDPNKGCFWILYSIHDIPLESRDVIPTINSPVIGTFQTGTNCGFGLSAGNDIIKDAFSGRDHVLHEEFVSNLVLEVIKIEALDLSELVKNALQEYLWRGKKWRHGDKITDTFLQCIEDLWKSGKIISDVSTNLHKIVRNHVNGEHQIIPCDAFAADHVSLQLQSHAISFVVAPDAPPILRCSRVKQVLGNRSEKFLILTHESLEEWRVLREICQNEALCTDLVLSVVSMDEDVKSFLGCVRRSKCRVIVISPAWKDETHKFLQSFRPSYTSWSEKRSLLERERAFSLPMARTPGTSSAHGGDFEIKMAALVTLRARRRGLRFQLRVNVAAARPLDDLVLRVADEQGATATLLVQLKHAKEGGRVPLQSFVSAGLGDYTLRKYFEQFGELSGKYDRREELTNDDDWLLCRWNLDELRYVIYTNKEVEAPPSQPPAGGRQTFPFEDLLETGDGSNTFSFHDADEVWRLSQGAGGAKKQYAEAQREPFVKQFLPRLRVFGSQANVQALDALLVQELNAVFKGPLRRAKQCAERYVQRLQRWAEEPQGRAVSEASEELGAALADDLRQRARAAAGDGALAFQPHRLRPLRHALAESGGAGVRMRVCVPGVARGHRAAKLLQLLDQDWHERWLYVDDRAASDLPPDALLAASASCRVVVVDVNRFSKQVKDFVTAVVEIPDMKLVIVSSEPGLVERNFPRNIVLQQPIMEDWRLEHFVSEVQEKFMDMDLHFQEEPLPLRALEAAWGGVSEGEAGEEEEGRGLRRDVDGSLLSAMLQGVATLGAALPWDDAAQRHHVLRSLQHEHALTNQVLRLLCAPSEHLVLSGFSREEVEAVEWEHARTRGAERELSFHADRWTVLSPEDNASEKFQEACAQHPGHNVHLVHNANGTLLWKDTKGRADAISKFVIPWAENCKNLLSPLCTHETSAVDSAAESSARVCLVLGEPGIGKSNFLCSLAQKQREKEPAVWAVLVTLLDHVDLLAQMAKKNEMGREDVARLLAAAAGVAAPASSAARRCLEAAVFHSGAVHVFVDGVDEVMPAYRAQALRLLQLLVDDTRAARLWVAARSEVDKSLRDILSCRKVFLLPLSPEEQLTYLRSMWQFSGHTDTTDRVAKELLKAFAFTPDLEENSPQLDRRSMLGVPLNLRLVGEAFSDDARRAVETNAAFLPTRVSQLELLQRFIEMQRERCEDRYGPKSSLRKITEKLSEAGDVFLPMHQNYAMLIWTSATLPSGQNQFHESVQNYKDYVTSEKTGILWQLEDGRFQFAHYTLIEFFVATWLFERRQMSDEFKNLFEAAYRTPRSRVMLFLDLMLAEGKAFHKAIIENDAETFSSPPTEDLQVDLGGRSPLHVAAAYGRSDCVNRLLESDCSISQSDSLLEWTALRYAGATANLVVAERLLERGADPNDLGEYSLDVFQIFKFDLVKIMRIFLERTTRPPTFNIIDVPLDWTTSTSQGSLRVAPLHAAAEAGSMRVAALLLEKGAELNATMNGETPLHAAVYGGHKDVVEFLISHGSNVNTIGRFEFTPLHCASVKGHLEVVQLLLSKGADVSIKTNKKTTPLHIAAENGHKEVVEFLEQNGADINLQTEEGNMPIHLAAFHGDEQTMEVLLRCGADIHSRGQNEGTPLHYASQEGHLKVVQLLLSKGADVSRKTNKKKTPLHIAAGNGQKEVVAFLEQNGADINLQTEEGHMPIHLAALHGHEQTTEVLLRCGADIHSRGKHEYTPLHYASAGGHLKVVQLLLSKGANVSRKASTYTPLHLAAQNGHKEVVAFLEQSGADINIQTKEGHMAIHLAVLSGDQQTTEVLLRCGADIHSRGQQEFTPLHYASAGGHFKMVHLLLSKGANVSRETNGKKTPLHCAAQNGHNEVVAFLEQNGADINLQTQDGHMPIHFAALVGHEQTTEVLLRCGADIHSRGQHGGTPLHYASAGGHLKVVQLLLSKGANVSRKAPTNYTPLHLAAQNGHKEVVELLMKAGAEVGCCDSIGRTPLLIALQNERYAVADLLFDADLSWRLRGIGLFILMWLRSFSMRVQGISMGCLRSIMRRFRGFRR